MYGMVYWFVYGFFEMVNYEVYYFVFIWLFFYVVVNFCKGIVDYGYEYVEENKYYWYCVSVEEDLCNDVIGVFYFL